MYYIGYTYESAQGTPVYKLVLCDTGEDYRRIRRAIINVGYTLMEFDEVIKAQAIKEDSNNDKQAD